jgi:hypothetical protein
LSQDVPPKNAAARDIMKAKFAFIPDWLVLLRCINMLVPNAYCGFSEAGNAAFAGDRRAPASPNPEVLP